MIIFFIINFFFLSFYSFSLIDPNLTLINHPLFEKIKKEFINFGYFHRDKSAFVYLLLIAGLFLNYLFLLKKEKINVLKSAFILGLISLFSYPFLSKDFFNYIFYAKIATFYGKNPYFYKPLDFPNDNWLRFMHWTHRLYPCGPIFLLIILIPSFFAFGKFILNFLFFKLIWLMFYFFTVYFLRKINRKLALIFAFHPLVLIEGLINNHNDLIAVSFAIVGIFYLFKNKNFLGRIFLFLSGGIKYLTLPIIFLIKKNQNINRFLFLILIAFLLYLSFLKEVQSWYFLNLFVFLPFFPKFFEKINIFFFSLLISYYPYLKFNFWNEQKAIILKHKILIIGVVVNILYLIFLIFKQRKINWQKII